MRETRVHRLSAAAPDDTSPLLEAFAAGRIAPASVTAILGKTEGNGCVNDFSRGLATRALRAALADAIGSTAAAQVSLVMSGGTEGVLAPHWLVLEVLETASEVSEGEAALAIGMLRTPAMAPWQIGRLAQVDAVALGVRRAMHAAGIRSAADVHYVQVKCPLLTADRIREAEAGGHGVVTSDTLKSMGLSRGAAALGVAVALGEIGREAVDDHPVGQRLDLFSTVASCSAGVELMANEIVVMGMITDWAGPLRIDHAVMGDPLDTRSVRAALARLGLESDGQMGARESERLVALLAKAEAPPDGRVRGHRHTMLDDSDLSATRHARAAVGGVLAGLVGHGELFVSGGAEHQGPPGGGPVALIATAS